MENCLVICKRVLEMLKVPYTQQFLKEKILTHPQYPSLLAISDTLEEYGVESMADCTRYCHQGNDTRTDTGTCSPQP
ncbi:hypothetical protein [Algoriphagus sp.]|uniref:hypothetical protein n=1 Tax=Algoriphagus sp. TaxID=1872435 RepID=UPI003F72B64C